MKAFSRLTYPYIAWLSVFIVAPMFMISLYAFTNQGNDTMLFQFTLENFAKFLNDPVFMRVLVTSLRVAFFTTVFCILIGYPAALIIANLPDRQQTMMTLLLTLLCLALSLTAAYLLYRMGRGISWSATVTALIAAAELVFLIPSLLPSARGAGLSPGGSVQKGKTGTKSAENPDKKKK